MNTWLPALLAIAAILLFGLSHYLHSRHMRTGLQYTVSDLRRTQAPRVIGCILLGTAGLLVAHQVVKSAWP